MIYNNYVFLNKNVKAVCKLEKEIGAHLFPKVKSVFETRE